MELCIFIYKRVEQMSGKGDELHMRIPSDAQIFFTYEATPHLQKKIDKSK